MHDADCPVRIRGWLRDMTNEPLPADHRAFLESLTAGWDTPRPGECLYCFITRALEYDRCDDTLRLSHVYLDAVAVHPNALAALVRKAGARCDCDVVLSDFVLSAPSPVPDWLESDFDGDDDWLDVDCLEEKYNTLPPCLGAPRGSLRPCANWSPAPSPQTS